MSMGCGDCGQLGRTDVDSTKRFRPVQIATRVRSVAAGGKHVVILAEDGVKQNLAKQNLKSW